MVTNPNGAWGRNRAWSGSKVRRRLGIPSVESLLAWAPADERGMRVPCPPTAALRRHRPYVALTDVALWIARGGVAWRVGLEDVVLVTVVGASDGAPMATADEASEGALRVDLVRGDPLVLLVVDGGAFLDHLDREIRAFDRDLQSAAVRHLGTDVLPPGIHVGAGRGSSHPSRGPVGQGGSGGSDDPTARRGARGGGPWEVQPAEDARPVLHEAEVVVLRELRRILLGGQHPSGPGAT